MRYSLLALLLCAVTGHTADLLVTDPGGKPLGQVMLTRTPLDVPDADISDDGYPPNGVTNVAPVTITRFTGPDGRVDIVRGGNFYYRARAQGYQHAQRRPLHLHQRNSRRCHR